MSTSLTFDLKDIIAIKNRINGDAVSRFKETHFKVSARLRNRIVTDFLNLPGPPSPTSPRALRTISGDLKSETREIEPTLQGTTITSGVAFGQGASRDYAKVHIGRRGNISRTGQLTRVHPEEILKNNAESINKEFRKTLEGILKS